MGWHQSALGVVACVVERSGMEQATTPKADCAQHNVKAFFLFFISINIFSHLSKSFIKLLNFSYF